MRKTPEARQGEIVDHALRLFAQQGLDATSINDIDRAAGVSKGGFYHHFASKHAVVDSIVHRLTHAVTERLERISANADFTPLQKLDAFFDQSVEAKKQSVGDEALRQLGAALFDERNLALRHALEAQALGMSLPYLSKIIREGVRKGVFDVGDASTAARHVLLLGTAVTADAMRTDPAKLRGALRAYRHQVDRMLGVVRPA